MANIEALNQLLHTRHTGLEYSFVATGEVDGRPMAFQVRRILRIPLLEDSKPLAAGLFVTDGEFFEKDFRVAAGRVFEPFEAASPEYPEREFYNMEKLKQVMAWLVEPSAGASAHPLCRLDFKPDVYMDGIDRVLAPGWTIRGQGPVWQVSPFYARLVPPLKSSSRSKIMHLAELPPILRNRVKRTDADIIHEAAQTAFERETALINDRLWIETTPPFLEVKVPVEGKGKVVVDVAHDSRLAGGADAPVCIAFDIFDEAGAMAFAEKMGDLLGLAVKRRGRLDYADGASYRLAGNANLPELSERFVDVMTAVAHRLPTAAVGMIHKFRAVADKLTGERRPIFAIPEPARAAGPEATFLALRSDFDRIMSEFATSDAVADPYLMRLARVHAVIGLFFGSPGADWHRRVLARPPDVEAELLSVSPDEAMLATRRLLGTGTVEFAMTWSRMFGPGAKPASVPELEQAESAVATLPADARQTWLEAIGRMKVRLQGRPEE